MRSWQSFLVFLLVFSVIMGGIHFYLYVRLARAPEIESVRRVGGWLLVASAVLMPVGMFVNGLLPRPFSTTVAFATYGWMGLVVLLLFGTLFTELVRLGYVALLRFGVLEVDEDKRRVLARLLSGSVSLVAVGSGLHGLSSALAPVKVKRVDVVLKRLPLALEGLKIAQITDVHVGPTIQGEWLRRVVDSVNELEADVVAITGDLVDGSVEDLGLHVASLADLRSKHGVFFVTGNHEYYSGVDDWLAELARLGIRTLRNEHVLLGEPADPLVLAGVDDYRAVGFGNGHGADLERALAKVPADREIVLLAHQPKQAPEAAKRGVGLQLSGHTHGGQIFPWGFFVKLDQGFVAGLDRIGDFQLYTSSGTGYWGPPVRVGAPAEITLLTLRRGD
jgi:uncharacterized protein